jgi:DNA-directed RNA polymerase beta' subunit
MDDEKEIKLVEQYLNNLNDEELREYPILPKSKCCIRLEFDIYKLYKYGLTLKSIVEKLNIFRDCSYICSPEKQGIIDVFFDISEDTSPDENDECIYTFKNVLLSFEISGIIGITAVYPRLEGCKSEGCQKRPIFNFEGKNGNYCADHKEEGMIDVGDSKSYLLDTDGSNLMCVLSLSDIDTKRTITNSLWEIRTLFGIESTRVFLINQILRIMSANGIYVHKKYIQLLADSMTYTGSFMPATRHGMNRKVMGTFCKASYEETLSNFIIAAVEGEKDDLRGISSRVILGLSGFIGSNYLKSVVIEKEEDEKKSKYEEMV